MVMKTIYILRQNEIRQRLKPVPGGNFVSATKTVLLPVKTKWKKCIPFKGTQACTTLHNLISPVWNSLIGSFHSFAARGGIITCAHNSSEQSCRYVLLSSAAEGRKKKQKKKRNLHGVPRHIALSPRSLLTMAENISSEQKWHAHGGSAVPRCRCVLEAGSAGLGSRLLPPQSKTGDKERELRLLLCCLIGIKLCQIRGGGAISNNNTPARLILGIILRLGYHGIRASLIQPSHFLLVSDLGQIRNCFGFKYFSVLDWSCLDWANQQGQKQ